MEGLIILTVMLICSFAEFPFGTYLQHEQCKPSIARTSHYCEIKTGHKFMQSWKHALPSKQASNKKTGFEC